MIEPDWPAGQLPIFPRDHDHAGRGILTQFSDVFGRVPSRTSFRDPQPSRIVERTNRTWFPSRQLPLTSKPSTVKARNFAYLSPIFRASLYSAELRESRACSRLSRGREIDIGGHRAGSRLLKARSGSSRDCSVSGALLSGLFFSRMEPSLARLSLITFDNLASSSGHFSPIIEETCGLKRRMCTPVAAPRRR